MAYKPIDWLGPLIENDVQAAVTWYKRTGTYANIKKDPSSRFEDDGSNLRSEVESPPLFDSNTVQIVMVLSTEDPSLLISDGFTSLRAWLSAGAAATLEAEIGDAIDLDMKGDIFAIRRCTIVSTPYGPNEGQVQLIIHEIKYNYHLRKIAGVAVPVGKRPGISSLMSEVMLLRHPEPVEESNSSPNERGNRTRSRREQSNRFETQADPLSPASQAGVETESSPVVTLSQSPQTPPAIVTQFTSRHRKAAPNMARDGIEMVAGVNLDRPTAAIPSRFAQKHTLSAPSRPAAIANSNTHLLSVLGKRKAPAEAQIPNVAPRDKVADPAAPIGRTQQSASPVAIAAKGSTGAQPCPKADHARAESAQSRKTISPPPASSKSTSRPKPYWQRKIPSDQRKLLDSPASWIPSLPGRQFPHPNVPIERLKRWNDQAQSKPESVVLSQSLPGRSHAPNNSQRAMDATAMGTQDSSGENDSESEVSWSSSPPRPALLAERTAIPANAPDREPQAIIAGRQQSSSLSSSPPEQFSSQMSPSSRPSTSDKRSERPPDSSFEHPVAPRALVQRQAREASRTSEASKKGHTPTCATKDRTSVSQQASPHSPVSDRAQQMSRPQSDQLQSPKGIFAPRMQSQLSPSDRHGRILTPGSVQYRPERAEKPKAWVEIPSPQRKKTATGSSSVEQTPVETAAKVAETSPDVQLLYVRQSPLQAGTPRNAPSSTAATVIQGTQINDDDGDDDAMEIDPPPKVDPTLEHQKRRSEYFRREQRRKWIKANYTPNPKKAFNLGRLYNGYKKAHPKDELRLSELAEAYEDVYPNVADTNTRDSPHGSTAPPKANENVASTVKRPRASLADIDASDATPSKEPSEHGPQRERQLECGLPTVSNARRGNGRESGAPPPPGTADERATKTAESSAAHKPDDQWRHEAMPGDGANDADARIETSSQPAMAKRPRADDIRKASSLIAPAALRCTNQSPAGSAASAASKAKAASDHGSWLVKRVESDQRRLQSGRVTSQRDGDTKRGGSFREFADAWWEIRPGGAFAEMRGREREGGKRQRGRLGVLGWEL